MTFSSGLFFGIAQSGYGGIGIPTPNSRLWQPQTYRVTSPPSEQPITLAQVKEYLKIISNLEDNFLKNIEIPAAREMFESYTNLITVETTFETFDDFFFPQYLLQRSKFRPQTISPANGLVAFEYLLDGVPTPVDPTLFYVTREERYSLIAFNDFQSIPKNKDDRRQSVRIEFVAGLGANETKIPAEIKLGLLQLVTYFNENRGDCGSCSSGKDNGVISKMPTSVILFLQKHRDIFLSGGLYRNG